MVRSGKNMTLEGCRGGFRYEWILKDLADCGGLVAGSVRLLAITAKAVYYKSYRKSMKIYGVDWPTHLPLNQLKTNVLPVPRRTKAVI
jgi:hypothetical protein